MKQLPVIAPSILSADFARLGEDVSAALQAGAGMVHVDVMDNHYVPNLTFGPLVCNALRQYGVTAPLDVHLMIEPVDALIPAFAEAGASLISFHPEASKHPDRTLQLIRSLGCEAGLAFNPGMPIEMLDYLIDKVDLILVMSVNPGFSGQSFIPSALQKLSDIRRRIDASGRSIRLEIDGGVTPKNIGSISAAGADTFVVGSAFFNTPNYVETVQNLLRGIGDSASPSC